MIWSDISSCSELSVRTTATTSFLGFPPGGDSVELKKQIHNLDLLHFPVDGLEGPHNISFLFFLVMFNMESLLYHYERNNIFVACRLQMKIDHEPVMFFQLRLPS